MWLWRRALHCLHLDCRKNIELNGLRNDPPQRASVYERKIVGFHQDDQSNWVADLECGHTQHVRHNPPWMNRLWVMTDEGRRSRIGTTLVCKKCEEKSAADAESSGKAGKF